MELIWLEDLVSVAEKGHFARAAEGRNSSQSALSRRIKALELWLGVELLDRTEHPIKLTQAGEEFMPVARDIISKSYSGRAIAADHSKIAETGVTIACLHTLSLFYVPNLIAKLHGKIGAFETSIVAETRTVDEYLQGLLNGNSDFFICYSHPAVSIDLDHKDFPSLEIGVDRLRPYQRSKKSLYDLSGGRNEQIPYLEYAGTSFMSRVVHKTIEKAPFKRRLKTVYRATLAESLSAGALRGLGVAWLPESILTDNPRASELACVSEEWSASLKISIYKSISNARPSVATIWNELAAHPDFCL